MAFVPAIVEGGVLLGGVATDVLGGVIGETAGAAAGSAIGSAAVGEAGKAIESGARSGYDYLFGEGSFQGLEDSVTKTYEDIKTAAGDVLEIRKSIENTGAITGGSVEKLNKDIETLNGGKVVKATVEFAKDFSALVSQGDYNALDSPDKLIIENNTRTVSSILSTLSKTSPFYAYLATKLGDSLADFVVPTSEEYIKVASVYNGEGINMMSATGDENTGYEFSALDETGMRQVWKYPEYNNYTVVPAIFGVYTGINSPNNALCLSGTIGGVFVESYLDKIAFLHDVGYHDLGSFNQFSDFQLISRAAYGKANNLFIFPNELATANTAIAYFSTLGKLMRKMFGDNSNVSQNLPVQTQSGIIRLTEVPPIIQEIMKQIHDIEVVPEEIPIIQQQATIALKNPAVLRTSAGVTPELGTFGSVAVSSSNFLLRDLLNNLEIQLD